MLGRALFRERGEFDFLLLTLPHHLVDASLEPILLLLHHRQCLCRIFQPRIGRGQRAHLDGEFLLTAAVLGDPLLHEANRAFLFRHHSLELAAPRRKILFGFRIQAAQFLEAVPRRLDLVAQRGRRITQLPLAHRDFA